MDNLAEFARRADRVAGRNVRLQKWYIRDGQNPFDFFQDSEFVQRYHFPKEVIVGQLLEIVRPHLMRNSERGLPIPPVMKLLIALPFYATSSYQVVCGDIYGVSQASVSLIVKNVSKIFYHRLPDFIRMPTTAAEEAEIALQFHNIAGFPGCN